MLKELEEIYHEKYLKNEGDQLKTIKLAKIKDEETVDVYSVDNYLSIKEYFGEYNLGEAIQSNDYNLFLLQDRDEKYFTLSFFEDAPMFTEMFHLDD